VNTAAAGKLTLSLATLSSRLVRFRDRLWDKKHWATVRLKRSLSLTIYSAELE
jgi:hypothetical protein